MEEISCLLYLSSTFLYFWLKYALRFECSIEGIVPTIMEVTMLIFALFCVMSVVSMDLAILMVPLMILIVIKLIFPNFWSYYYQTESKKAKDLEDK